MAWRSSFSQRLRCHGLLGTVTGAQADGVDRTEIERDPVIITTGSAVASAARGGQWCAPSPSTATRSVMTASNGRASQTFDRLHRVGYKVGLGEFVSAPPEVRVSDVHEGHVVIENQDARAPSPSLRSNPRPAPLQRTVLRQRH